MPEGEHYEPTPEEISKAKEMMTDEEKVMAERRNLINSVIAEHDFYAQDASYSDFYEEGPDLEYWKEYKRFLEETHADLRGNTLIDFGCGFKFTNICRIAQKQDAAKYVGVEPFANVAIYDPDKPESGGVVYYSKKFPEVLPRWKEKEGFNLDIEIVGQEGLRYLSSLPDNSANITVNGIDDWIVRVKMGPREFEGEVGSGDRYFQVLAEEIARVAGRDHIIFGLQSPPVFKYLEAMGLEKKVYREKAKYPITVCRQKEGVEITDAEGAIMALRTREVRDAVGTEIFEKLIDRVIDDPQLFYRLMKTEERWRTFQQLFSTKELSIVIYGKPAWNVEIRRDEYKKRFGELLAERQIDIWHDIKGYLQAQMDAFREFDPQIAESLEMALAISSLNQVQADISTPNKLLSLGQQWDREKKEFRTSKKT